MTPDINPIYALLERSCTRYSKNVSYVDVGLVQTGLDLIFSEYAIHFQEFFSIDPFPIVHFYYQENQENEDIKLVLKGCRCPIFMKLSGKPLQDVLLHLRQSPGASETSKSSKSPGRDQEEGGVMTQKILNDCSLYLGSDLRKQVNTSPVFQVSSWSL